MLQLNNEIPESVLAPYRGDETAVVTMVLNDGNAAFSASGTFEGSERSAPEDMIFEIGSITKVFTALLLSLLVEEGKIDPDRPIRDIAKELSDAPAWITLNALATHTSGLPRIHTPLWKAIVFSLPDDPYAAFSRQDLIAWLKAQKGAKQPRRLRHAYSNLGFGLLGEAMAKSVETPFMDLLTERVLTPLGLSDTTSSLTKPQQARFMQPFSAKGKPVVPWTFQSMAGAGCLRSSARDLGRFSSAVIEALANPVTPLESAIRRSVSPMFGLGPRGALEPVAQCLGWLSIKLNADAPRMLFHNGGTAGSICSLYICPEARSAALILANRGIAASICSNAKLRRSNPDHAMSDFFAGL